MYLNVELELLKKRITKRALAEKTGLSYSTLCRKLKSDSEFDFSELKKIKAALKSNKTLEELFEKIS